MSDQTVAAPDPAGRQELLDFARKLLGSGLPGFLETGDLPSSITVGEGSYGELRDARSHRFDRTAVALYSPGEEERETCRAWHDYCSKHGYPRGDLLGADEKPGNSYPPRPSRGRGEWVGMKWPAIRRALLEAEHKAPQLALEVAA